jgi:microcystin-dependent protein
MDGYVGEMRYFAATFAPRNWAFCMGQTIAIRSNTALFSIIGTYYGGNGTTTFNLPNFGGRAAIGVGTGAGLSPYDIGQTAGTNTVTLTNLQLPMHTHVTSAAFSIPSYSDGGDTNIPTNNVLASKASMYTAQNGDTSLKAANYNVTIGVTGTNAPLSITQPSLGMNCIICLFGIFPPRS